MKIPLITKYSGVFFVFGFGLLCMSFFSGCENQQSYANEPDETDGAEDKSEDNSYSMEQMTDLEQKIQQLHDEELKPNAVVKTPREIELEAELSECKNKLSILMYSNSDNPK